MKTKIINHQEVIQSIPTLYNGVTFRSRLEAKWAAFFDLCGWRWLYEPFDLKGYQPDFVLQFYKPLLVEVKPCIALEEFKPYLKKIETSGWKDEAMIVGACVFSGNETVEISNSILGLLAQRENTGGADGVFCWGAAQFQKCRECKQHSIFHYDASYHCRVKGCYDGDGLIDPHNFGFAWNLFAEASRQVQWKGVDV